MKDAHTDDEGTPWVSRDGKRYVEVARVDGGQGEPAEVCLSPEDTLTPGGWWNAAEMNAAGMVQVEPGSDGEGTG